MWNDIDLLEAGGDLKWSSEWFKMSVNISASYFAQVLRTQPMTPSRPVTFHGFILRRVNLVSASVTIGKDGPGDVPPSKQA